MKNYIMPYNYVNLYGVTMHESLVDQYNILTVKIDKLSDGTHKEFLKGRRHQVINYYSNPASPFFIGY